MRAIYFNLARAYLSSGNLFFDNRMITEAAGDSFHDFFRDIIEKLIRGVTGGLRSLDLVEKGRKILDFVDFVGEYLIKQGNMLLNYENGVLVLPVRSIGLFTFEKFFDKYFEAKTLTDFLVIRWRSISSGEQSYLTLFSRFYQASADIGNNRNALIIICDEADIYFHPEWQRRLLSSLLKYLPSIFQQKDIQLILTSNTPYLVSDLPASNVILIENNGSKIRTHTSAAAGKRTFAANIHSLLSDEFFVSNLIGEFAKEKIEAVIRFLDNPEKKSELDQQSVKAIIDNVGEPIIRHRLQDLYDSRFQPNRSSLQEEKRRLKTQLEHVNRLLDEQQNNDKS